MSEKNEWKLVPVEATPEMVAGYWDCARKPLSDAEFPRAIYRAMLALAPTPSAPGDAQDKAALLALADRIESASERPIHISIEAARLIREAVSGAPAAGDALDLTLAQKYEDACIFANANARDAARYRWLRDPQSDPALVLDKRTGYVPEDESVRGVGGYYTYEYRAGEELDAAIDAALAAQVPHKGDAA